MSMSFAELPEELKQIDDRWAWRELLRTWITILAAMLL